MSLIEYLSTEHYHPINKIKYNDTISTLHILFHILKDKKTNKIKDIEILKNFSVHYILLI